MSELDAAVVAALGVGVLEHVDGATFRIAACPPWLGELVSGARARDAFDVVERFPFLEPFLDTAWDEPAAGGPPAGRSGLWVETGRSGEEVPLEAVALRHQGRRVLLLASPGPEYRERRATLTRARTAALERERLHKEVQKKEILLHCIVHDLAQPLTGISGALDLLEERSPDPRDRELIAIGKRLCANQAALIRSILDVFAAELSSPHATPVDPASAPAALETARRIAHSMRPRSSLHGIELEVAGELPGGGDVRVAIDARSLERVLLNLLDNALRHSPQRGLVSIVVGRAADIVELAVDDQGPGVAPADAPRLFQKLAQGPDRRGKIGLGLYFCRITAERWGGSVGQQNRPGRGSRFWVRLPAAT